MLDRITDEWRRDNPVPSPIPPMVCGKSFSLFHCMCMSYTCITSNLYYYSSDKSNQTSDDGPPFPPVPATATPAAAPSSEVSTFTMTPCSICSSKAFFKGILRASKRKFFPKSFILEGKYIPTESVNRYEISWDLL